MKTMVLASTLLFGFAAASFSLPASAAPISIGDLTPTTSSAAPDNPLLHHIQSAGEDTRNNRASDGFQDGLRTNNFRFRGNNFRRFRDRQVQNRGFNQNRRFTQNRFQQQGFSGQRFRGNSFQGQGFKSRGFQGHGFHSHGFTGGRGIIVKRIYGHANPYVHWHYESGQRFMPIIKR